MRLQWRAGGRHADHVPAGDDSVGGAEFHPTRTRDKDGGPGMGRAAAGDVFAQVVARGLVIQVSGLLRSPSSWRFASVPGFGAPAVSWSPRRR